MRPPYGKCGEQTLSYYTNETKYTRLRCLRECTVSTLYNRCGCKMPYMPGEHAL